MSGTDPRTLRFAAYAEPAPLAARQAIYRFQRPHLDLPAVMLRALAHVRAGAVVGDLGCGNGAYLQRLAAGRPDLTRLALDLSSGMLTRLDPAAAPWRVAGSLAELPLRDRALDAALAMHVLYHVADPGGAIEELRRVIRDGGVLVVSTNAGDGHAELWRLVEEAGLSRRGAPDHWPLEHAESSLRAAFDVVELQAWDYVLEVPTAYPVLAYLDSTRALVEGNLPPGRRWDDVLAFVRRRVTEVIEERGSFRIHGRTGLLTAT